MATSCEAMPFSRSGSEFGQTKATALPTQHAASGRRSALCITGQLRALPLAYCSWQQTVFPALLAGGAEVDIFLVTSNSSSFRAWEMFARSLNPVETYVARDFAFNSSTRQHDLWTVHEAPSRLVSFNVNRLPIWRSRHNEPVLIQQWQHSKCAKLIRQHEQRVGASYWKVARMRTDVVFHRSHKDKVPAGRMHGCVPGNEEEDAAGKNWVILSDFFLLGSRNASLAMMDGLEWLAKVGAKTMKRVQEVWYGVVMPAARRAIKIDYQAFAMELLSGADRPKYAFNKTWDELQLSHNMSAWQRMPPKGQMRVVVCASSFAKLDIVRLAHEHLHGHPLWSPPPHALLVKPRQVLTLPFTCLRFAWPVHRFKSTSSNTPFFHSHRAC